ncbi:MAG: DedA family protein [Chloroflexi bacterium]|nr:MAG: DedA family protein [Chloroflexota bacterium]TMG14130.1 MAG: DedA family protein [Chloroflexota bacterium]TMG20727.1 MAG: DedA family protein [Chloroflexota bacterium]TMG68466.1 MAG: DedA family protein [Chloroflexota bacterium]
MGPVGQHRHQYHHRPDQPAGLLQLRDPHRRSTGSNPAVQGGEGSRGSDRLTAALSNLVASYGLLGVFVLMVGESCGLPLPSEVIMPTAGLLAATGHMQGGLIAAIVAGALANLVGSLIAYVLAARFGEPLLLGPGRYVGIRRHHLEMADGWFRRWGLLAVFIGRVLPVIRTYISFPAGLARIDLAKFSALTLIGALPWCAALALVGYLLGRNYDRISGPLEKGAIGIAILVAIVVVVWYVRGREPRSRKA